MSKLTPQKKLFAYEYIIDNNATQAAIRAGYSQKTAYSQGQRLLKDVEVKKIIDSLTKKHLDKLEITAEKTLNEIAKLAYGNATDFIEISDSNIIVKDLSSIDTTFIAGAEEIFDKEGMRLGVKLKFHDKSKNLEMLMRHQGLFKDKIEHTVDSDLMSWLQGVKNGK